MIRHRRGQRIVRVGRWRSHSAPRPRSRSQRAGAARGRRRPWALRSRPRSRWARAAETAREAADKAGGRGAGGAAARDAVDRVMLHALHGIGKSGDWCRQGALGSAAKGVSGGLKSSGGGGAPAIDYPRLLARKSCAKLLQAAALPLVKAGYPKTDVDGGRRRRRLRRAAGLSGTGSEPDAGAEAGAWAEAVDPAVVGDAPATPPSSMLR